MAIAIYENQSVHMKREKKPKVLDTMGKKAHISCNISINQIDFDVLEPFLSPFTMCD